MFCVDGGNRFRYGGGFDEENKEGRATFGVEDQRRAARRRRMEIRRFKVVAESLGGFMSVDSGTKRLKISNREEEKEVVLIEEREKKMVVLGKEAEDGNGGLEHGVVSICGRRSEMEDAFTVAPLLCRGLGLHFFAVYDGHGGPQAAMHCKEELHKRVREEICEREMVPQSLGEWQSLIRKCFLQMDADLASTPDTAGTTAVIALLTPDDIVVGNCGDSRAVLSRGGTAIPLSSDHKPDRPDEMARIERAGGRVICWNGHRVLGVLAMSRAIGDGYLKPYVVAEPEVTVTRRSHEDDECLVIATDGLWDVLPNDVACHVARKCLRLCCDEGAGGATLAASLLTKLALARGSIDNISVLVVDLRKPKPKPKPKPKTKAKHDAKPNPANHHT